MTEFLPTLLWRPSPNFSSRRGTRVDLLVLHDREGGYEGSVRRFELSRSSVSAHYVVREDGTGARQRKWSTSPIVPGMHALSIGAPLASRWVGSRVVV
jgi:N-acetyl-anhydromuramyl-L-alanine amidase AmpD